MSNESVNNTLGMFEYHDNGFTIDLQKQKRKVAWGEIESINAYKVDMMTFDVICVDIVLQETFITLPEETAGWDEFIEKLQLQFPAIDKDWWGKVAFPPFETNFTTIYKRE